MTSLNRRFVAAFLAASAVVAAFFYASFFYSIGMLASEWTGSGFIWPIQLYHNFLNGRPFQSSMCASAISCGQSVGFSANPYAFIHAAVVHVNWTPYLFAPVWGLHPTPAWLYAIQVVWCLGAGFWFARSILRRLDPAGWRPKLAFAAAVLLSSGLLSIINQMAQFLVYAGPLMLAVYDAALARRRGLFILWVVALCLIGEDAAMVAATFGAYLVLFERDRRVEGLIAGGFATVYLALVLGVVQPAARAELTLTHATTTGLILKKTMLMTPSVIAQNLKSMLPAFSILPALGLAAALFGGLDAGGWLRLAALVVLPALPHWGESVVVGGAHHLTPPFWAAFLALLVLLGRARASSASSRIALGGWLTLYALLSLRALVGNMPSELKLPLLRRLRPVQAEALSHSLQVERASNAAVVEALRGIPKTDSLCFLGNVRITGFVFDRSDVWEFPDQCGVVRYIVVQKDAIDVNFVLRTDGREALAEVLSRTRVKENTREVPIEPRVVEMIRRAYPTHRALRDDGHLLILENPSPAPPQSPRSTVGFGWLGGVGHARTASSR